jgi:predicted nucleic acid-binding protein
MYKLAGLTNRVLPKQRLDAIQEDPPDNRILECAVEAGSEYIVSWDKDLLRLGEYSGMRIIRPPELLQLVAG